MNRYVINNKTKIQKHLCKSKNEEYSKKDLKFQYPKFNNSRLYFPRLN